METGSSGSAEPLLGYHSFDTEVLTFSRDPARGHSLVGSLTGAVSSQRVTEAPKGHLSTVGNRATSVKA